LLPRLVSIDMSRRKTIARETIIGIVVSALALGLGFGLTKLTSKGGSPAQAAQSAQPAQPTQPAPPAENASATDNG
jgi:hypothetical protein